MASLLSDAGYRTAYFGKWHCGTIRDQLATKTLNVAEPTLRTPELYRAGFQDWYGFELINSPYHSYFFRNNETTPTAIDGYQTDGFTNLFLDYLSAYDAREPLFAVLSVEPPHFPLEIPPEGTRFELDELHLRPNAPDTPETRSKLAAYYAMVENVDANVGRIVSFLQTDDRFAGNTLLVYLSDHGEYMGSHGLFERKEHPHEEGVRIPLIFHWPERVRQASNSQTLIGLVDLLPTVLDLVDVSIPDYVQGRSHADALRIGEDSASEGTDVLLEMCQNPRWSLDFVDWRAVVTPRYKYAFYETGDELLYDLKTDPYEQTNLVTKDPQLRGEMRERLLKLLHDTKEPFFDVMINHGRTVRHDTIDIGSRDLGELAPAWERIVR